MKNFSLFLSMSVYFLANAAPTKNQPSGLEFDNLDTDLKDLKYEVEEEDLDDYSKLLDEADADQANTKTTGFKNRTASKKGSKENHNIGDLKKFFQAAGVLDHGGYDDDEEYALAQAFVGKAVGVTGNEDRKYRKGTKTRGFHRVHHKDEYKKDKLFYEDDETSGAIKKVGAKGFGLKVGAGTAFDRGHFHHNHQKGLFGKQGFSDRGYSDKGFKEFADSLGLEKSYTSES